MRHMWLVARHDLRRQWRDGGVAVVVATLVIVTLAAIANGQWRAAEARTMVLHLETREQELASEIARLAGQHDASAALLPWNAINPDFLANDRGTLAIAPPAPLLALSAGQTALFPSQVKVTAASRATGSAPAEIANPLGLAVGTFDVEFVVVFLWPLAIIALTFDLLSGERERGTLHLLLAHPVRVASILGGLLLARGAVVILPALAVPWLALTLLPGPLQVARLMLWSTTAAAYALLWLGIAAWIAARHRPAVANAVGLGTLWVVVTLAVPGAIHLAALSWGTVPSDVAFADATRAATRDALSDGSRVLGHFLEDHPTASAVGRDGLRQYALLQAARDEEVARRLAPVTSEFERAVEQQRRLVVALRYLSPAMLASDGLQQAAGSSGERARDFMIQVADFRTAWRGFFQPRVIAGDAITVADAAALPRFHYHAEDSSTILRRALPGVSAMIVGGLALIVLSMRRLQRAPLGAEAR